MVKKKKARKIKQKKMKRTNGLENKRKWRE